MAMVRYEAFCPKGQRLDVQARELARRLTEVVRILLDQEANDLPGVARYKTEVATTKTQRDRYDIQLMRHVAHCTKGCVRASGGPMAFAAVNQPGVNSRAPSHQKPPMPGGGELAARIRAGATVAALAEEYDRSTHTVRTRILESGFSSVTGDPNSSQPTVLGLALLRLDDQPWAGDALCAQTDPEAFYPEKGGSTREAKQVCASCTVAAECLDYALDHDERFGIWGGLSERERRKIKSLSIEPGRHLSGLTCALDGCDKPTTRGDTGRPLVYCTPEHKRLANTQPLTHQESA